MASKTAAATTSFGKKIVTSGAWKALRPFFKVVRVVEHAEARPTLRTDT